MFFSQVAQVGGGDGELVGDSLVADMGGPVRAGGHGDPVLAQQRDGLVDDELAAAGTQRGRVGDDVDLRAD
jgi:hypothetical protein